MKAEKTVWETIRKEVTGNVADDNKHEVVYDCHCNASYRGHSIMRDDENNCFHVYEAGDKDATMLWTGDSVEVCKATIDEVLDDMDEVTEEAEDMSCAEGLRLSIREQDEDELAQKLAKR